MTDIASEPPSPSGRFTRRGLLANGARVGDAATLAKFRNGGGQVAVCDEAGPVVGHFVPTTARRDPRLPDVSEEELDRIERENGGGGRSLDEILADLAKRA